MTDDKNINKQDEPGQDAQPAAEPKNTDTEHMIPKDRFDEINSRYKEALKKAEAAEKALKEAQEIRLKEKEDYKALYEQTTTELSELKPKAEQFEAYKQTMQALFDAQVEEIPEELRALIPDEMSVKQKIDWIAKNKKLLLKPVGPDIGAGQRGAGSGGGSAEITPTMRKGAQVFGLTDEQLKRVAKRNAEKENK
jgi:DNA repair exonuclease SbcCD ATPase subunit